MVDGYSGECKIKCDASDDKNKLTSLFGMWLACERFNSMECATSDGNVKLFSELFKHTQH